MAQGAATSTKKILVVDDSMTVRKVVEKVLGQQGYEVHSAENGQKGLDLARTVKPDLVLVDFVMPGMYGHVFCKSVREISGCDKTPLVLISAKSDSVGYYFEKIVGVVHRLAKPFEATQLLAVVTGILGASTPAPKPEPAAVDPTRPAPAAPRVAPGPEAAAAGAPATIASATFADELTERIDRVVGQYFRHSLPQLMRQTVWHTLAEAGLVERPNLVLSASLELLSLPDVLNFIHHTHISGQLTLVSSELIGELWVDKGMFVFAKVSRRDGHDFLSDLLLQHVDGERQRREALDAIRQAREQNVRVGLKLVQRGIITEEQLQQSLEVHGRRALQSMLEASEGSFHLDSSPIPEELLDVKVRLPLMRVLMDGLRLLDEKKRKLEHDSDEDMVLVRMIGDNDDELVLNEEERRVFDGIDGHRTVGEIVASSRLERSEALRLCRRLCSVGAVRRKNAAT